MFYPLTCIFCNFLDVHYYRLSVTVTLLIGLDHFYTISISLQSMLVIMLSLGSNDDLCTFTTGSASQAPIESGWEERICIHILLKDMVCNVNMKAKRKYKKGKHIKSKWMCWKALDIINNKYKL